jgi:hypothetical protein
VRNAVYGTKGKAWGWLLETLESFKNRANNQMGFI